MMEQVMKKGEHYGVIPGTDKPTLYKPGAEMLLSFFRLSAKPRTEVKDLGNNHREYVTVTALYSPGGVFLGEASGSCSTMESKYRRRKVSTGNPVPGKYWNLRKTDPAKAQELLGGPGFSAMKEDGQYYIGKKGENPDIADLWNTCLKMAEKRSMVAAVRLVLGVSDVFEQDLEDLEGKLYNIEDQIAKMVEAFGKVGVTEEMIVRKYDELHKLTGREIEGLRVQLKNIKADHSKIDKYFPPIDVGAPTLNDMSAAKDTPAVSSPPTPEDPAPVAPTAKDSEGEGTHQEPGSATSPEAPAPSEFDVPPIDVIKDDLTDYVNACISQGHNEGKVCYELSFCDTLKPKYARRIAPLLELDAARLSRAWTIMKAQQAKGIGVPKEPDLFPGEPTEEDVASAEDVQGVGDPD